MKKLFAALALVVGASSAQAALVTADLSSMGDALITRDTETGLEWLDLTYTAGRSYDDVSSSLATEFAGWSYATAGQVTQLWTHLGLGVSTDIGYGPGSPSFQAAFSQFRSLFGDTFDGGFFALIGTGALGVYNAAGGAPNTHLTGGAAQLFGGLIWGQITDPAAADSLLFALDDDAFNPVVGHYLVRAPAVPIPAAGWLLISGIGAVAAIARRRRDPA